MGFWEGFEKRAYDYEYEAGELKKHYEKRSKDTPVSKLKAGLIGGGLGLAAGAGLGALRGVNSRAGLGLGAGVGALMGAAGGSGIGVLGAMGSESAIERAQDIVDMPPAEQKAYLRHLAREDDHASRYHIIY